LEELILCLQTVRDVTWFKTVNLLSLFGGQT